MMAYSRAYAEGYAGIDWSAHANVERKRTVEVVRGKSTYVMSDIAEFVSPVNYELITSRSQLRDHERRHKVRQCGELTKASDFDNTKLHPQQTNEKALEAAYRKTLEKLGL
jgi:hypothetical protein